MATKKAVPTFPVKKAGRPKKVEVSELDKLKSLVARQDDLIAQLQDDLRDQKNTCEVLRDECNQFEEKIESYREILKTLLEITE